MVPQRFGADGTEHLPCEDERPVLVAFDRRHESVGDQDREIEVAQPPRLMLGGDEGFDIGMVAPQCRHHRAAAGAGGHDGAAHRVPYIHEGQRPRCVGADALDRSAFWPQRREVVAYAAALLHRQRGFAQVTEYAAEIVLDVAHHKAVEQRHAAPSAGARQDPSRRQETEIFEHLVERHLPSLPVILWGSQRAGDAPPAVLYRDIDRGAVVGLQPILGIPDLPRDRGDFDRDARRFRIRAEAVPGSWSGGRGSRLERRDVHIHCALLVFCVSLALGTRRRPGQGRRGGSACATDPCGDRRRVAPVSTTVLSCPSVPAWLSAAPIRTAAAIRRH